MFSNEDKIRKFNNEEHSFNNEYIKLSNPELEKNFYETNFDTLFLLEPFPHSLIPGNEENDDLIFLQNKIKFVDNESTTKKRGRKKKFWGKR